MSKTEPAKKRAISFEVEIESGGRAHRESDVAREVPVTISPARAAAKARARSRNIAIAAVGSAILLIAIAWAWITNPLSNVPQDAVARVNGQFIYERDVEKRLNMILFLNKLYERTVTNQPNSSSALEDLITEYMMVQDARKANLSVKEADVDEAMRNVEKTSGRDQVALEEVLSTFNLKLADLRDYSSNTLLWKYREQMVTANARDEGEAQNLYNQWLQDLIDNSKVDRFKAAGAGPAPRVGAEAPDFTLKDLDGKEVKLSSLRGKPVMVNFWATWCPPCREEIPVIAEMYNSTQGGSSYEVLGVATQSDTSTIKAFAREFGMEFPLLPDASSGVVSTYHVLPIPTTFFVDKDGIIRFIQTGPVTRALMEKWLLGN